MFPMLKYYDNEIKYVIIKKIMEFFMRILGIDPGYAILGYGIIDVKGNRFSVCGHGAITTDSSMDMPDRAETPLCNADGHHSGI